MEKSSDITIYCDGAARGNPGPAAAGVFIHGVDGDHTIGIHLGTATNNQAEYAAVLAGLGWLRDYCANRDDISSVTFILDSELVVKQLRGEYKVKNATLKKMYQQVRSFEGSLESAISYRAVKREKNQAADRAANQALDITRIISWY